MTSPVPFLAFRPAAASRSVTIIEEAASKLRAAIMQGELRPGQKLVEADLSRILGISRASLREALRALEAQKLITIVPHRGPSVAKISHEEVDAIHEVWAALASDTVADVAHRANASDITELEGELNLLKQAVDRNAPLDQLAATNRFLILIMEKHGNPVLTEIVGLLISRVNFLRAQALLFFGWGVVHAQEIENMVKAIKDKDPEMARSHTCTHIASACASAKHLTSKPGLAPSSGRPASPQEFRNAQAA